MSERHFSSGSRSPNLFRRRGERALYPDEQIPFSAIARSRP